MKITYVLWGFGLIIGVFGIWQLVGCIGFFRRSIKTDGRLVAWEKPHIGDADEPANAGNSRTYRAVVAFTAADGSRHRVRGTVWTKSVSAPPVPAGQRYAVRYDPRNPDDARVATLLDFWLFPLASVAIGVFLILLALRG
jgi:hypothetical protein